MQLDLETKAPAAVANPDYVFVPSPKHWDRTCHRFPCSETDRLDAALNGPEPNQVPTTGTTDNSAPLKPNQIRLTPDQVECASSIGLLRWTEARRRGLRPDSGTSKETDIEGACKELAYCLWRGIPWPASVNVPGKLPDCGGITQIRSTKLPYGRLIVRKKDSNRQRFVLVIGARPFYTVVGHIMGSDAKRLVKLEDFNGRKQPCHMVPQSLLNTNFDWIAD